MPASDIDILMITHKRPDYTARSLRRLLDTCDESMRVWIWHNGTDPVTVDTVKEFLDHPRVYRFHQSSENVLLREPTNWFWQNSTGAYLAKVDDDCLMPLEWASVLRSAHSANPKFGVIGCWHFPEEDFLPDVARKKIRAFDDGHELMMNCWVGGSGYLMKRACVAAAGLLKRNQSFTNYCIKLAIRGWINGWYYPFLYQDHLDDPRSPHSLLRTDEDMHHWAPLSAINNGVRTVAEWQAQLRRSARLLQWASADPLHYSGWRRQVQRVWAVARRAGGVRRQW